MWEDVGKICRSLDPEVHMNNPVHTNRKWCHSHWSYLMCQLQPQSWWLNFSLRTICTVGLHLTPYSVSYCLIQTCALVRTYFKEDILRRYFLSAQKYCTLITSLVACSNSSVNTRDWGSGTAFSMKTAQNSVVLYVIYLY